MGAESGVIGGTAPLLTLDVPFWKGLAGSTHRHRLVMSMAILMGAAPLRNFRILSWQIVLVTATLAAILQKRLSTSLAQENV